MRPDPIQSCTWRTIAGAAILAGLRATGALAATAPTEAQPHTLAEVVSASQPSDWHPLDPANTLYVELATGRVVIELAPQFAPRTVANVRALAREKYYDGIPILRVQDNYVVQWGDPDNKRSVGSAARTVAAEFVRPARDLPFTVLPDPDTYAPEVGFVGDFPAARDPRTHTAWLTHCYGMVGAGRDNDVDSGGGTELYVVIGHSPRNLDRNVTLLGRVVWGMELLSSLPRGTGALGFYEQPAQRMPIRSIRVATDVPEAERSRLEIMRTDTSTFTDVIEARRNRHEDWYKVPAGRIDLCNVPILVRQAQGGSGK